MQLMDVTASDVSCTNPCSSLQEQALAAALRNKDNELKQAHIAQGREEASRCASVVRLCQALPQSSCSVVFAALGIQKITERMKQTDNTLALLDRL